MQLEAQTTPSVNPYPTVCNIHGHSQCLQLHCSKYTMFPACFIFDADTLNVILLCCYSKTALKFCSFYDTKQAMLTI